MFRKKSVRKDKPNIINPTDPKLDKNDEKIIEAIWQISLDHPLVKNKNYPLFSAEGQCLGVYQFTHDVKIFLINPLNMTPYQRKLLYILLNTKDYENEFKKNKLYLVSQSENIATFIKLTRNLIFRKCSAIGKHAGEERFEVVGFPVASGTFGLISSIEGTLFARNQEIYCKTRPPEKRRLVKMVICRYEEDMDRLKKEYMLSARAGHLHVKKPSFAHKEQEMVGYMVMRKMPGMTLFDLLDRDKNGSRKLTCIERIDLAIAVLQALHNQVHAKNIIHKDFKSNNILVHEEGGQFHINIIDYGLSESFEENDSISLIAHYPYVAPELRACVMQINTYKSDIYSAARVLGEIFGFSTAVINEAKLWQEFQDGFCVEGLFTNISDISSESQLRIRESLCGLGHPVQDKRWSIPEGVAALEMTKVVEIAIKTNYHPPKFSLW